MLVYSIDIFRDKLPIGKSVSYDKIENFIEDAENDLQKVIGKTFYDELDSYEDTDETVLKLIEKLQSSISYTAYYLGFDIVNTNFSNQGLHRIEEENSGKKSLFQRQEIELKLTFKRTGQNKLDDALLYLEKNKANFATWTGSQEYTLLRQNFINSTDIFHKYFPINSSRLLFLKLRPFQTLVEDFDIIPVIGREYFDELKTQIAEDNLSDANKLFMARLEKAVAQLTIYHGGYTLLADMNEFGLFKIQTESGTNNFKTVQQLEEDMFGRIISQCKTNGDTYMKSCESFLKANIDNYPTYEASDAYDADAGSYDRPEGTDKIVLI